MWSTISKQRQACNLSHNFTSNIKAKAFSCVLNEEKSEECAVNVMKKKVWENTKKDSVNEKNP